MSLYNNYVSRVIPFLYIDLHHSVTKKVTNDIFNKTIIG